jgi:hypothetical protein
MRNAVTLCVSHNRLDAIGRQFKLFGDFGDAHAIVEVIALRRSCATLSRPSFVAFPGQVYE